MALLDDALLRALIARSDAHAVFLTDVMGVPRTWHPGVGRLFGYEAAEWVGLAPARFWVAGPEGAPGGGVPMAADGAVERWVMRRDGERRLAAGVAVAVDASVGAPGHVAWMLADRTEEALARRGLEESERRLARALEISADAYWEWEIPNGRFLLSANWYRMLGYPPGAIAGTDDALRALMHPDDLPAATEAMAGALRIGSDGYVSEHRLRSEDGGWRWVLVRGRVVERDAAGAPRRLVGINTDVTARHEAEEAQRERERTLRTAQRLASVGSWSWEPASGAVRFSEELFRIYGGTPDTEPTAAWFLSLVHPDDRAAVVEVGRSLLAEVRSACYEYRVVRPDGGVRTCMGIAESVLDERRGTWAVSGAVQDVTTLRATEAALRQAQRVARLGSWTTDGLGTAAEHTEWSEELWRIVGLPAGSVSPSLGAYLACVHPDDRVRAREAIEATMAERRPTWTLETRVLRPDGTVRICEDRGGVSYDVAGQPVRVTGTVQDVTDRRTAEEERRAFEARLQEVQRLESVGVLAGGVAHDFNNLLAGIMGNADLLRDRGPADAESLALVTEILDAVHRAAELTGQLLTYAGKAHTVLATVDVAELVRGMEPLLRSTMPPGASLTIEAAGPLPVRGDRRQLTQLLLNLLTNAAEALQASGGRVVVRVEPEEVDATPAAPGGAGMEHRLVPPSVGRHVRLDVSDNGTGMSPAVEARMFDPFFTTKFVGRGLGLPVTLGIVRAHGGGVAVRSAVGAGTTVRVWLPAADEPPLPKVGRRAAGTSDGAEAGEPALPGGAGGGDGAPTVLVVDDEPALRRTLRRVLERAGLAVVEAANGNEAVALLTKPDGPAVDLVVLDYVMPQLGGAATLDALARTGATVPVLLMSGFAEEEVRASGGAQVAGFLAKPFTAAEVLQLVQRALGRREAGGG